MSFLTILLEHEEATAYKNRTKGDRGIQTINLGDPTFCKKIPPHGKTLYHNTASFLVNEFSPCKYRNSWDALHEGRRISPSGGLALTQFPYTVSLNTF